MEISKEIQKERERISRKVKEVIGSIRCWRKKNIRNVSRRNVSLLDRIEERILFHIDNPNYIRKYAVLEEPKP